MQYLREAAAVLAHAQSETERDLYAGRVAADMGVNKQALVSQIEGIRRGAQRKQTREQERKLVQSAGEKYHLRGREQAGGRLAAASAQRRLLAVLYANPDLCGAIRAQIRPEDFLSEDEGAIFTAMCGQIERDEFSGVASMSSALPPNRLSILSGIVAEAAGVNFGPEDADFLIDKIVRSREAPTGEQVKAADPMALQKLIEKKKNGNTH